MNKTKKIAIGVSNFRELRELDAYYVDKTLYIKDIIDNISDVLLITRPRKFGKTLSMSMLEHFFDITKDSQDIFKGLKIMKQEEKYTKKLNSTPVIFISLKDIRQSDFDSSMQQMQQILMDLYKKFTYLLDSNLLFDVDKEFFSKILNGRGSQNDMENAVKNLCIYVKQHYKIRPYLLLDEYDVPLQNAYMKNYYDESLKFFRCFFGTSFKDNEDIEKAIITGVSEIAKESIFSGLNNIYPCTITDNEFSEDFGITETEMQDVLKDYNIEDKKEEIATWYDGYVIGDSTHIYNPWSIMNYLDNMKLRAYWINTSSNDRIEMEVRKSVEIKPMLEDLLNDIGVLARIDDESIFGLMLKTGYIKITEKLENDRVMIKIVNYEVKQIFEDYIKSWFDGKIADLTLNKMLRYLTEGNIEEFEKQLNKLIETTFNYFDAGEDTAENFYHAFVLGLLVNLKDTYSVRSNRESGFGRYDIMLEPKENKNDKAIIMEFKVFNEDLEQDMEHTLNRALEQIESRKYETELNDKGFRNVMKVAFAFKGKYVKIKVV